VETIKEAIWVSEFNDELKIPYDKPIPIYTDSQATIDTTKDVGMYAKTKYYNKDLNFIREKITDGTISLIKISREENSSDLMTNKRNKEETLLHGNKLMGKQDNF
jgi:hypothetical protein